MPRTCFRGYTYKALCSISLNVFFQEMLSRSSLETQKLELLQAISEMKLQQASLERENLELRTSHYNNNSSDGIKKPPLMPRMSPQPQHTSTPVHSSNQVKTFLELLLVVLFKYISFRQITVRSSPSPSPVTGSALGNSQRRIEASQHDPQPPKVICYYYIFIIYIIYYDCNRGWSFEECIWGTKSRRDYW